MNTKINEINDKLLEISKCLSDIYCSADGINEDDYEKIEMTTFRLEFTKRLIDDIIESAFDIIKEEK